MSQEINQPRDTENPKKNRQEDRKDDMYERAIKQYENLIPYESKNNQICRLDIQSGQVDIKKIPGLIKKLSKLEAMVSESIGIGVVKNVEEREKMRDDMQTTAERLTDILMNQREALQGAAKRAEKNLKEQLGGEEGSDVTVKLEGNTMEVTIVRWDSTVATFNLELTYNPEYTILCNRVDELNAKKILYYNLKLDEKAFMNAVRKE